MLRVNEGTPERVGRPKLAEEDRRQILWESFASALGNPFHESEMVAVEVGREVNCALYLRLVVGNFHALSVQSPDAW